MTGNGPASPIQRDIIIQIPMHFYKNNNIIRCTAGLCTVFIILCTGCFATPLWGVDTAPVPGNRPHYLRIQVLSKQVRLLRQGLISSIVVRFPAGTEMRREGGSGPPGEVRGLSFRMSGGRIHGASENGAPCGKGLWTMTGGSEQEWTVSVSGEVRRYPLPLTMKIDGDSAVFIVRERLERFALDSARAEYGPVTEEQHEALQALRVLIAGRALQALQTPHHGDAEFCDLTHCQVYRGRIGGCSGGGDALQWVPDIAGLSFPFLFHSRCGGNTFDGRVFGSDPAGLTAVEDWCSPLGRYLCRGKDSSWRRILRARELASLIIPGQSGAAAQAQDLRFDRDAVNVTVVMNGKDHVLAPEDFRLKINRVKGWNFIRSNNYRITPSYDEGEQAFCFEGQGMGHGAGFCQHGALALAAAGYSWYDILKHYYPGIRCVPYTDASGYPPGLSWAVFSLRTGNVLHISHRSFSNRTVPPGSVFKLLVSLYCMTQRPDIIRDYRFHCHGRHRRNETVPECWLQRGHGSIGFTEALACSCNSYFGSLSRHIDRGHFQKWTNSFLERLGIGARCAVPPGDRSFARLLGGLDFSMRFRIEDFMRLLRLVSDVPVEDRMILAVRESISTDMRNELREALFRVVREGTASAGRSDEQKKLLYNQKKCDNNGPGDISVAVFGKTATVMDGTNRACSYGIFIGGTGAVGVMVLLRDGNGHRAAQYGMSLLREYGPEQ